MLKSKTPAQMMVCYQAWSYTQFRERYRLTDGQAFAIVQNHTRWEIGKKSRLIFTVQSNNVLFLEQANPEDWVQSLADWYRKLITPPTS